MIRAGNVLTLAIGILVAGCDSAAERRKDAPTSEDVEASSTESAAPRPGMVSLKRRPPAVGDKETQRRRTETKTSVDPREAKDGVTASTSVYVVEKTEECLEVHEDSAAS